MSELTVRPYTEDLFDEVHRTFTSAFLRDPESADADWFRSDMEPDRISVAFDQDELVGIATILTREMTLPGAVSAPVAAVTTVAVKPWHRRRGALTRLMHVQLHALHEQKGEPFAALWASEGSIYGRFGYSVAAEYASVSIPSAVPFRPGTNTGHNRVREVPRTEALPLMTALHDKLLTRHPGWLARTERSWRWRLWDQPRARNGASMLRFAVHPDGYAFFRTRNNWEDRGPASKIEIQELVAATPSAHAALWRYLLDMDQVREVTTSVAPNDPVLLMLHDPRQAIRRIVDSLWIRLVDIDRALPLRKYSAPLDTVFDITDTFCPWNEGRWRLVIDPEGTAAIERATTEPDFALDITDLGAVFLGGVRLTDLAAAGRVTELVPGTVTRAGRAFLGDTAPHCLEVF
ncbi:GNAT family N-acetyltransferase [Actinocrispum sp. NPDC049592]|uniref:GNAT family N-acetyltransferase n=1 Tax=Actinocrispum sp. NPDC049592 TaxID=3154835 RepID=UPI003440B03C